MVGMMTFLLMRERFHYYEKTDQMSLQKITHPQRHPQQSNRFISKCTEK
jgi:hypothetical protein